MACTYNVLVRGGTGPGLPSAFLRGPNLASRGWDIPCVLYSHGHLSFGAVSRLVSACFYQSPGLIKHPWAGEAACSHSARALATLSHLLVGDWVQSVQRPPCVLP